MAAIQRFSPASTERSLWPPSKRSTSASATWWGKTHRNLHQGDEVTQYLAVRYVVSADQMLLYFITADHGPFLHGSPLPLRRRCIEFDMLGTSLPSRSLSDRPLMEEEDGRRWLAGSTGSLHPPVARLEEDYRNNFPPLVDVANKTPPSTDSSASTSSGVVKDSPPVSGCYDDAMLAMSFLPTGKWVTHLIACSPPS